MPRMTGVMRSTRFPTVTSAFTWSKIGMSTPAADISRSPGSRSPATIPGLFAAISCLKGMKLMIRNQALIQLIFPKCILLPLLFCYLLLLLLRVLHAVRPTGLFFGGMSVAPSRHPVGVSLSLKTITCYMAPPAAARWFTLVIKLAISRLSLIRKPRLLYLC